MAQPLERFGRKGNTLAQKRGKPKGLSALPETGNSFRVDRKVNAHPLQEGGGRQKL